MKSSFVLTPLLFLIAMLPIGAAADAAPSGNGRNTARRPRVIVVGGGLSGLITAWQLEKRGIDTTIVEANDRLGGRVATARYGNGLQAEYGMQEIWEKNPLLGIIKELGLEVESSDDPYSSLIIDGKFYPFVQETRELYFGTLFNAAELEAFKKTIAEMESIYQEAHKDGLSDRVKAVQEVSFHDWLAARNLPRQVDQALRLTIEVELAASAEQFSALSAILEYRTFLFKGETNHHVKGGNYKLIDALARRIRGEKLLNSRVTEVVRTTRRDGSVQAEVTYMQKETVKKVRGDAVVVTVPWMYLHFMQFRPALRPEQWQAIESLGRGQYTVVHLTVDRAAEKSWLVDGEDPFPILSNGPLGVLYGPHATDTSGPNVLFSMLIYGLEAQAYHMQPRDNARKALLAALDGQWAGFSKHVRDVAIYTYHPAAVAFWPPGRSPLDEGSRAILTPNEGLFLAGDWTVSSHAEGAVISALETAKGVARFLKVGVK